MKNILQPAVVIMMLLSAYSCSSGHYVSTQPDAVIVTRPAQPGPNHIWVDGDYYWRGGRYNYRQGYWAATRGGRAWRGGTWAHTPRGYYWRRGGWRR